MAGLYPGLQVRCTAMAVTVIVRRLSHRWHLFVGTPRLFLPSLRSAPAGDPAVSYITRSSSNLLGGTEILDHILHTSPSMTLSPHDAGSAAGGLLLGIISDYRPEVAAYSGILARGSRIPFTRSFAQARSLHICRFRSSPKHLMEFFLPKFQLLFGNRVKINTS